jgi:rRNA-processing protein FCF1
MVTIVLLDSNFLFLPMQFKVDIFEEIPRLMEENTAIIVLSGVKDEIVEKNKRSAGKLVSKQGLGALQLLAKKVEQGVVKKIKIERHPNELVDDYIVRAASQLKSSGAGIDGKPISKIAIATNDKQLKSKCVAAGFSIVQMRQKTHLEIL